MIDYAGYSMICLLCDEDLVLDESEGNPEAYAIAAQEFVEQHRACEERVLAQMGEQMKMMCRSEAR